MAVHHLAARQRLAAMLAAAALLFTPAAAAEPFRIFVDQTIALKLASPADSVVLGNPAIADVAVHDPRTLLVTGKTFGSTNLLVLNNAGQTVYEGMLNVTDNRDGQVRVITRLGARTYSCLDKCQPTPSPGGVNR